MPVVLRVGGFSFGFYRREHEPPHVHVRYSGGVAIIEIESGRVRHSSRMTNARLAKARRLVQLNRAELLAAWQSRPKEG